MPCIQWLCDALICGSDLVFLFLVRRLRRLAHIRNGA